MDIKQQILYYYRVDELSLRDIARKTGADRKTVTRLINAYEAAIKEDPEMGVEDFLWSPFKSILGENSFTIYTYVIPSCGISAFWILDVPDLSFPEIQVPKAYLCSVVCCSSDLINLAYP